MFRCQSTLRITFESEKRRLGFYFEFTVSVISTSKSPLISFWLRIKYCLLVHFLHVITNIFISLALLYLNGFIIPLMSTANLGFIHFVLLRLQQNLNSNDGNFSFAKLSTQALRWRVLLLEFD